MDGLYAAERRDTAGTLGRQCHREKVVPDQHSSDSRRKARKRHPARPLRVLLVDADPKSYQVLAQCVGGQSMQLLHADSLAEARRHLAESPVDLALIECDQPDGNGLDLAGEISSQADVTQTIMLAGRPELDNAVGAIRAGAGDYLTKPIDADELFDRVGFAQLRHKAACRQKQRVRRLRRVCRKLNHVRKDVGQQVDILCKDLVTAYQELAEQMNQVVQASEFTGLIRQELDLEELLRKTLEFLLQKAGPTNAAIFLPSSGDEFSIGGYVNYDCTSDSADILIDHLADVIAPRLVELIDPLHLVDNDDLEQWVGDDSSYLMDCHVVAFACRKDEQTLAIVMLFRDASEPYDPALIELCDAISPMLGDYLARLNRIHHRHINDFDINDGETMWDSAA